MRKTALLAAAALVVLAPACHIDWSERLTGTAMGGAAGGALGGLVAIGGTTASGIILGVIAGAAAGYIIGDYLSDQRERACCSEPEAPPRETPSSGSEAAPAVLPAATRPRVERPAPSTHSGPVGPTASKAQDPGTWRAGVRSGAGREEYEAGRRAANPNEALSHYAAAIRLDPVRPEAYNAQGLVYLYIGRTDAARRSFDQALAVDPTYEPAKFNRKKIAG